MSSLVLRTSKIDRSRAAKPDRFHQRHLQLTLFEATTEHLLFEPTFIIDYPAEVSPLARRSDKNPEVTERFELYIAGREIANGFSELNDPDDQAARFQPVQGRIEGAGLDLKELFRRPLYVPGDGVSVRRAEKERAENQQIERALEQFHAGQVTGQHCVESLRQDM